MQWSVAFHVRRQSMGLWYAIIGGKRKNELSLLFTLCLSHWIFFYNMLFSPLVYITSLDLDGFIKVDILIHMIFCLPLTKEEWKNCLFANSLSESFDLNRRWSLFAGRGITATCETLGVFYNKVLDVHSYAKRAFNGIQNRYFNVPQDIGVPEWR